MHASRMSPSLIAILPTSGNLYLFRGFGFSAAGNSFGFSAAGNS